jgi:hypothetical protein
MAVTDQDGRYEIRHVPTLEGGKKPILAVWHEMLPGDHILEIGAVELRKGELLTRDFAIPKR